MNKNKALQKAINLHLSGKNVEASKAYNALLVSEPSNLIALNNLASLLNVSGEYEKAKLLLNRALYIKPNYIDALNNLGISMKLSKEFSEAVKIFEKIINLKPDFVKALINLGNSLQSLNRFEDALKIYKKASIIQPESTEVLYNEATCLNELNYHKQAILNYKKILKINPNFIEAKWNLAFIQLLKGNYKDGWENHEIRKKRDKTKNDYRKLIEDKNWLGKEKLKDKTIYVLSEQGLGDYIQFCRYLPMLKNLGAKIIVDTPESLDKIIRTMKVEFTHIAELKKVKFDYNCLLLSLPLALNTKLETIPNKTPYLFTPKDKKDYWREKLGKKSRKRIGLMWNGNPENENNHNRSINLKKLIKLLDLPYEFHSLQINHNKFELEIIKKYENLFIHEDEIKGFDKTAGLIESMDLIISVDTSVAHLSGALNKMVWILLAFTPDYRWLLNQDNSPWYPSAKLYRQSKKGDWDNVIENIRGDLKNF